MRITNLWLACIGLACFALSPASVSAKSRGSHFIAELDAGAVLTGDAGPCARVAFGVGGKFRGFPARFYLIGHAGTGSYQATGTLAGRTGYEEGRFEDFGIGPRVYLPIAGPLRVFVDGTVGTTLATGSYYERRYYALDAYEWLPFAQVAGGLSLRIFYELAVSVRAGFAFNGTGLSGVARYAGVHDTVRPTLSAGVTWHF